MENESGITTTKTVRAFEKDILETHAYVNEMKRIASERGYIFNVGRGHTGTHINFQIGLFYRLQNCRPVDAVDRFPNDFMPNELGAV